MAGQGEGEGGRWDVGTKDGAVFVERRSEDNEQVFTDRLDPVDARKLAELLNKFADKAESADVGEAAKDDDEKDQADDDKSDSDDESKDDDESEDDESDDDDDRDSDDDKDSDKD